MAKGKSMEKIEFMDPVRERDIDLLLMEELTVSSKFRRWFIKQVCGVNEGHFKGVWHSVSDSSSRGESDLVLVFVSSSNKKYALFIENKLTAPAQKNQPERYTARGNEGVIRKEWDRKITCIVAPKNYLAKNAEAERYESQVSYESILDWLKQNYSDSRGKFKFHMLKEAIESNRRGYTQITDPKTTKFHYAYYKYAHKHYPELEMKEPIHRASGQSWIEFCPRKFKKKIKIVHKGGEGWGFVDLQFNGYGNRMDYVKKILNENRLLKKEMELEPTGKSVSLRINTPTFDPLLSFESQKRKVKLSLDAAIKLYKTGCNIINELH